MTDKRKLANSTPRWIEEENDHFLFSIQHPPGCAIISFRGQIVGSPLLPSFLPSFRPWRQQHSQWAIDATLIYSIHPPPPLFIHSFPPHFSLPSLSHFAHYRVRGRWVSIGNRCHYLVGSGHQDAPVGGKGGREKKGSSKVNIHMYTTYTYIEEDRTSGNTNSIHDYIFIDFSSSHRDWRKARKPQRRFRSIYPQDDVTSNQEEPIHDLLYRERGWEWLHRSETKRPWSWTEWPRAQIITHIGLLYPFRLQIYNS